MIGETLEGKCHVLRRLGAGGMGTVYEGVHTGTHRPVREQAQGLADVDHRADLWSLGPTLHEVIATAGALGWAYGLDAIAERATGRAASKNPLVGREGVEGAVVGRSPPWRSAAARCCGR